MRLRDYSALTDYDKLCIAYDYKLHLISIKYILKKHQINCETLDKVIEYENRNSTKSL